MHSQNTLNTPPARSLPTKQLRRTNTALVLEDDKSLCFLITRILRRAGWTVHLAGSVGEALNSVNESIEVAFVDINLPDGDGIHFLKRLVSLAPFVRPIVISSESQELAAAKALGAGAVEFLPKPLQAQAVIAAARRAVAAPEI